MLDQCYAMNLATLAFLGATGEVLRGGLVEQNDKSKKRVGFRGESCCP